LKKVFIPEGNNYRVCKEIRNMVSFATQNIIMDPPFTKLDILICRNLLIYLTSEVQKKLLPLFHYILNPGGFLFLGSAETVGAFTDNFKSWGVKPRLLQRRETVLKAKTPEFPATFVPVLQTISKALPLVKPSATLQFLADQLLLQHFFSPAVLTNNKGDILYLSGRTGKYIEPPAGKANWNIFAMTREGLRIELGCAVHKAIQGNKPVTVKCLNFETGPICRLLISLFRQLLSCGEW
jgi:two-component system CheB/CheR fusion protein